ncbi:MAG TPA: RNA polymerase subunit sigma-24 [Hyphomonas sp.]|nr:RNA polymerase subunit sigma-24 [Hyphomonas sp.]
MAQDKKARMPKVQLDGWVRQYGGALRNYFRRRAPGHADPDDLTQEVFARLARRGNLSDINIAEAYLFQTANSVLIDSLRRTEARGGSAHEEFEDGRHGTESLDPERLLIGKEAVEKLVSALYELPEPVRQAFALYHFEEFRHADIAGKLGISVSTVEKYMARANAHLLARLRDGQGN